ncbi:unnamed protein product [Fraxinus pennsylvanica]|uniref:Uncharacterized protein n=1 Tax=Fraxinus pennsylvanica TaxID=56036 RepID=A0AAD2ADU7_9LAMI|nr:unnamed protein product [Fraxinus pennsylvanica]
MEHWFLYEKQDDGSRKLVGSLKKTEPLIERKWNLEGHIGDTISSSDLVLLLISDAAQLQDWLYLSMNHLVPTSLLILSSSLAVNKAFTASAKLKPKETIGATLSSLPDEVVNAIGMEKLSFED